MKMQLEMNAQPEKSTIYATEEDKFGLLVQKGGGPKLGEWLKLPMDTKRKVARLHKLLKLLPDSALSNEIAEMIQQELGVADYQRLLYMLFQGGYLRRDQDVGHRIIHVKTSLAKSLNDEKLAADMYAKNQEMVGFPVKTRQRKSRAKDVVRFERVEGRAAKSAIPAGPKEEARQDQVKSLAEGNSLNTVSRSQDGTPYGQNEGVLNDAELHELLRQLTEPDYLMVKDLIKSLTATREIFPRLGNREFLLAFVNGSKYVEG